MPTLTLASETHSLLALRQEWKQAAEGLLLWMEEKWSRVAGDHSQACSSLLQKLRWHKTTQRELLASRGFLEDLQQVRMLGRCEALLASDPQHILPCPVLWSTSLKEGSPLPPALSRVSP